ncbi:MAG: ABC transporter substrate-binding protein, partial [Chloroflexota bacterium]
MVPTDPIDFDLQFLAVSPAYAIGSGPLYNSLLINYLDEDVECDVCSEWHLENGGKTMVFTLRQGIKFHTGQELTSADVKYSLRMIMGDVDGIVSPRSGIIKEYIDSIETPSRYVVRINMVRPSAYVPKVLANANSVLYREGTTRDDLRKAPAGTGPFVVKQVVPGASRRLERNPNYFKPGQPYLDAVAITLIVDTTTQVASFVSGRDDIWQGPSSPPEQYMPLFYKIRDEGKVNWLDFLGGSSLDGTLMYQGKPPFNNLKLRQALNLAIDREKMGLATWGDSLKPPQLMVYSQEA